MSANPPLRLLAIDPGLAHFGAAFVHVEQMHRVDIIATNTVVTKAGGHLLDRLSAIRLGIADVLRVCVAGDLDGVVIEDPTEMLQRDPAGRRKDPRNLYKLCAAFGVIVGAVSRVVFQDRISLVPVVRWYPRNGRAMMRHDVVLARIRERHPELVRTSEHVCFAIGLADWWSASVAPLVWDQQRRAATATHSAPGAARP